MASLQEGEWLLGLHGAGLSEPRDVCKLSQEVIFFRAKVNSI